MSAPADSKGGDWRQSVAQSFRSEEVRSIAKVLASLEPGATSASKTMLAMRFEESIFKAASGLDDYRKTIQKRLKKLQKHYAKQQQKGAGEGGDKAAAAVNADLTREKELLFESELRDKYGARLLYIAKHADQAVAATRQKSGDHKADVLRQHATNAKQWAVHLGIELPENCSARSAFVRQEKRDMDFLKKLKTYLDTRVENIRSHIVKITDPDLFLEDALSKIEDVFLKQRVAEVFQKVLKEADPDTPQFNVEQMKQLIERMNAPVPIPRRNQEGDRVRAAVARIEKVRAAAQALYVYAGLPLASKTSFPGAIVKCHTVVMECLNELEGEFNQLVKELDDKDEDGKRIIQLEDAWNTPMQFTEESEETASIDEGPDSKRQKTDETPTGPAPMVIRSRYLLTPGRNTFSSLLPAMKRKKAILVRHSSATFVKLEFGKAFEMIIYFVPLLVTIRAMATETADEKSSTVSLAGELRWPSLYQGLRPPEKDTSESNGNLSKKSNNVNVLGVSGSYESLAPIIAKKLEYASAQATYVLRRCFADTTVGKAALAKSEFEVEILEAGALIRFLQMARATYIPDWVDEDA
eukprot:CAMPEP_0183712878 /NCGR_PEP_ID=MMETSP0737-20130205/7923_1 /TAXON_ID=385413 /ORGANISM="Thalassiosira miniscula, Strain CCMP1093" /LENGTH=582 /DNA_ID=CAMNT_0025941599 /DNA_START=42 /DNA_END=1790 /DNA_ORIENTATION=+